MYILSILDVKTVEYISTPRHEPRTVCPAVKQRHGHDWREAVGPLCRGHGGQRGREQGGQDKQGGRAEVEHHPERPGEEGRREKVGRRRKMQRRQRDGNEGHRPAERPVELWQMVSVSAAQLCVLAQPLFPPFFTLTPKSSLLTSWFKQ